MDKNSVVLILKECFNKEGNCAILHFQDGSDLLINKPPTYANLIMNVHINYECDDEIIDEIYHIPYSSILYIVSTNTNNLKKIIKEQEELYKKQYESLI